jgi:hypothetical protein
MYDFGHVLSDTSFLAQTSGASVSSAAVRHPHRRRFSRPDFRQASHFQPAWLEN